MTAAVAERADLRTLSLEDLAGLYDRGGDDTRAAILAEATRRDRADRARDARRAVESAWYDAAFAQYLAAEQATNGYLLSRAGEAAGITDAFALWRGPERLAMRYGSEELLEFWRTTPRLTVGEYRRQLAAERRAERAERDLASPSTVPAEPESETAWEPVPGGAVQPVTVPLGTAAVAAWAARATDGITTLHPTRERAEAFLAPAEPEVPLSAILPNLTSGTAADQLAEIARFADALAERGKRRLEQIADIRARSAARSASRSTR